MQSKDIMYSKWNNNEMYTPKNWVIAIIPYIKPWDIVWCPFDTEESEFVIEIKKAWFNVVFSHINTWQDFFNYLPSKWDVIISNPPFTNKRKFFERALSLWKPFALIMTNTWLNDSAPKKLFKNRELQLLMFENRMKFSKPDGTIERKITFVVHTTVGIFFQNKLYLVI